jgi:hypothetical protein
MAERASRYSVHIDKHCDTCGQVENDYHLFFQCSLPNEVWSSFQPNLNTTNLPIENDGIQLALSTVIPTSTTDVTFHMILFTLWYIWKARNDFHFNRRRGTTAQIHHAAAAYMESHNIAFQDDNLQQASLHTAATTPHTTLHQSTPLLTQYDHRCTPSVPTGMPNEQEAIPTILTDRYFVTTPALLPGPRC